MTTILATFFLALLLGLVLTPLAWRIREQGEQAVFTSIIVACELRFGAAKRQSPKLTAQVEAILAAMDLLPLEAPVDEHYAWLRLHLEQTGTPIGPNDL